MCNEAARRIELGLLRDDFSQTGIPLVFPEGVPNRAPLDSFRITDATTIIRGGPTQAELVMRRWNWPGAGGKPVYDFRSDRRTLDTFGNGGRVPNFGRLLLRIHRAGRPQQQAQERMAVPADRATNGSASSGCGAPTRSSVRRSRC